MPTRRDFLSRAGALSLGAATLAANCTAPEDETAQSASGAPDKPNFIILFADDMGYGDWNGAGHPTIHTPNLNRMAAEGTRMTQFYSGNPVCSPSRSSLMTGRINARTGVIQVFFPGNGTGMSTDEITIADALKPLGYKCGCFGKWHLGSTYEYRPLRQGFDYYFGILYSNDMYNPDIWRNDERFEHPSDQTTLTKRYTEEAIAFIDRHKDGPFFVYLPYTMPHIPLFRSEKFVDVSRNALYGDVIEELDWSVGQILDKLEADGLAENTFVIFTSDNGPWMVKKLHGGNAGMLRGAKGDTWEGGMREPAIFWWPGNVPAGKINMNVGSVLDFFPTLVTLAGGEIPDDRPIDGIDLMPVLQGESSPERTIFYYRGEKLRAVRKGKWKLHFSIWMPPTENFYDEGTSVEKVGWKDLDDPMLFDIEADIMERFNVAADNPAVVADLTGVADAHTADLKARGENQELFDWFVNDWEHAPRKGE